MQKLKTNIVAKIFYYAENIREYCMDFQLKENASSIQKFYF